MPKSCLHGHEIVWQRDEQKGQRHGPRAGRTPFQGKEQAEQAAGAEKAVAQQPQVLEQRMALGGVRCAVPEEDHAVANPAHELPRIRANESFGFFSLSLPIGHFAHPDEALELGIAGPERHGCAPGEGAVSRLYRPEELDSEVVARGDEGVQRVLVADDPGGKRGSEDNAGKNGTGSFGAESTEGLRRPQDPENPCGQYEQQRGVGERNEPPQQAKDGPESQVAAGFDASGSPMCRRRNAKTKAQVKRQAVSDISQSQWMANCRAAGYTAQSHADQSATGAAFSEARRARPWASKQRAAIS